MEDKSVNQMKTIYSNCAPGIRNPLLHYIQETVKELTELAEKFVTLYMYHQMEICFIISSQNIISN